MTNEDLIPYIELDAQNFWLESLNPINTDTVFSEHGIEDIEKAFNAIRKDSSNLFIVNTFLKMNYLLKGEYFIAFMNNIVLTNRRLFIWFSDLKKNIPLCNLRVYERIKDKGITIEYLDNGALQKLKLTNTWLNPNSVNNAINKYKHVKLTEEEIIIANSRKPILDSLYKLSDIIPNYDEIQIVRAQTINLPEEEVKTGNPITIKPTKNYSGLIKVCLFFLLIGGCGYYIEHKFGNNTNSTPETRVGYDSITGKKMKTCPWCGGIGRVGYAGASKAQCERTGMGLGNYCTECNGTGYVKDDGQ